MMGIAQEIAAMQLGINSQDVNPSYLRDEHSKIDPNWQPTTLPQDQELQFLQWVENLPFYNAFTQRYGEPPDLNTSNYDYRGAYLNNITPTINPYDNSYHWPTSTQEGQYLKSPNHPTAWMNDFMINTGGVDPTSGAAQYWGLIPRTIR